MINKKIGLTALLNESQLDKLLNSYNDNSPFFVKKMSIHINEIIKLNFLDGLDELLASWSKNVFAHLPDVNDEANSIEVSAEDAAKLFKTGLGLRFSDVNKKSQVLEEWLKDIQNQFGFSQLTNSRCIAYATPKNKGNAAHFDQNYNIVLQLTGKKKWWIAENNTVYNPLTRHTLNTPTDPELQSYTFEDWPESMPNDAQEFELGPGSLLFVPRGAWHQTLASEDSLALNFTFSAPTYLDTLSAALRGRLAQSPKWRDTIDGLNSEEGFIKCSETFNELLEELKVDVQSWEAMGILGATEFSQEE